MKIEFNESVHYGDITITPETVEELTALVRFAMNAKKEKPDIYLSVSSTPYLSVFMRKVAESKQVSSIRPGVY